MKKEMKAWNGEYSGHGGRPGKNMQIKVLFLGSLTEITQTDVKHYKNISSFSDLKHRVEDEFPGIIHYRFRIAVNYELVGNNPKINNGDVVAYFPLFAGD